MLVLTQTEYDGSIHLTIEPTGEHIEIKILGIKNKQIKWGLSAPNNVTILRDKLYQALENAVWSLMSPGLC